MKALCDTLAAMFKMLWKRRWFIVIPLCSVLLFLLFTSEESSNPQNDHRKALVRLKRHLDYFDDFSIEHNPFDDSDDFRKPLNRSKGGSMDGSKADLCRKDGIKPVDKFPIRYDWDIRKEGPFKFLPNYKNPCFIEATFGEGKLRCLPYFFIIGTPKCGTTDLWKKLTSHPDIVGKRKEPMFLSRFRFGYAGKEPMTFKDYLDVFDKPAKELESHTTPGRYRGSLPYHHMITGEGSVDTFYDNHMWTQLPGNEGCSEPAVTNADYLYHINPNMKLILVMRDPIERLYSEYLYMAKYLHYNISKVSFGKEVKKAIRKHKNCRKFFSLRGCAYNASLESGKARLRVGMYYLFLEDWYRTFPKEQIFIIRAEDLATEPHQIYRRLFTFLGVRPLAKKEEMEILGMPRSNVRSEEGVEEGSMLTKTRNALNMFYKQFNENLAKLVGSERFLWKDTVIPPEINGGQ